MYPLFETVCVKNAKIQNAEWHQWRYELAYRELYNKSANKNLFDNIKIPSKFKDKLIKLKISYNIDYQKVEFSEYIPKKIQTLKIIHNNNIDYSLKYSARTNLLKMFDLRENCDDVLIVKNNFITDTSFANIIFFDGQNWITSATPLLKGTARERLLKTKIIKEKIITINDLNKFSKFKLINAMRDIDDYKAVNISNIML